MLRDYPIATPEILIEGKARASGLSIEAFRVPEIVVMVYNKSELQRLVEITKATVMNWLFSSDLYPLYRGRVEKQEIGLVFPGWGAPTVAARMEELIACGAKIILASGAVGAFQPKIEVADYIIPTEAIRGEGTSQYYLPKKAKVTADLKIVKVFEEACEEIKVKFFTGQVWTTDAIYREMKSQVKRLQRQGVLGVEMETAAIYAVAKFRKIQAGCLLRVSDSLANLEWQMQWWSPKYKEAALETSPKILVEALKLLS